MRAPTRRPLPASGPGAVVTSGKRRKRLGGGGRGAGSDAARARHSLPVPPSWDLRRAPDLPTAQARPPADPPPRCSEPLRPVPAGPTPAQALRPRPSGERTRARPRPSGEDPSPAPPPAPPLRREDRSPALRARPRPFGALRRHLVAVLAKRALREGRNGARGAGVAPEEAPRPSPPNPLAPRDAGGRDAEPRFRRTPVLMVPRAFLVKPKPASGPSGSLCFRGAVPVRRGRMGGTPRRRRVGPQQPGAPVSFFQQSAGRCPGRWSHAGGVDPGAPEPTHPWRRRPGGRAGQERPGGASGAAGKTQTLNKPTARGNGKSWKHRARPGRTGAPGGAGEAAAGAEGEGGAGAYPREGPEGQGQAWGALWGPRSGPGPGECRCREPPRLEQAQNKPPATARVSRGSARSKLTGAAPGARGGRDHPGSPSPARLPAWGPQARPPGLRAHSEASPSSSTRG